MPAIPATRPDQERAVEPDRPATRPRLRWSALVAMPETRWAVAATALFALGAVAQLAGAPAPVWWGLYLACYLTGGWGPAVDGLRALRQGTLDVDVLMVVAAVAAAAIGQVFDGALLIVIFATSGALEAFVTRRTADAIRGLLDLAPDRATVIRGAGEVEEDVDTADLVLGDVVLVRPGDRIGADGVVVAGLSEVDQAAVTGEPLPVERRVGDEVLAGTLNGAGALRVRVSREAADSVIARIGVLVEQASATKARTQLFIEKVEQRYSIGVVVATLALVAVPLAAGAAFEPTLLRAMTFMIVASPCAVVLATMPPLLAAIAHSGRRGLLVKSAVVLERLREVSIVAFDKTGTLTDGVPRVVEVVPATAAGADDPAERGPDEVLALAAAVERASEHPIGRAVTAEARSRALEVPDAEDFTSTPGRGASAVVAGVPVTVGSPRLLAPGPGATVDAGWARAAIDRLEQAGRTAVVVLSDERPIGVLGLADRLRPDARATVDRLAEITGTRPVLLTGDNHRAAARLAAEAGITDVRAGLLPEDKLTAIRELETAGHRVMVVGDGVNDAPALAAAHVGVAMGRRGSDLTLETADAVVVRDELALLPGVLGLADRAHRVVRANLAFAATVIAVLVVWDIGWLLPLPLGVAGHEGSTIAVGLNGLRLLRARAWPGWRPDDVADTGVDRAPGRT